MSRELHGQFVNAAQSLEQGQGNSPLQDFLRGLTDASRSIHVILLCLDSGSKDFWDEWAAQHGTVDNGACKFGRLSVNVLELSTLAELEIQDLDRWASMARMGMLLGSPDGTAVGFSDRLSELFSGYRELELWWNGEKAPEWAQSVQWKNVAPTAKPIQWNRENFAQLWSKQCDKWLELNDLDGYSRALQIYGDLLSKRKIRLDSKIKVQVGVSQSQSSIPSSDEAKALDQKMAQLRKEIKQMWLKSSGNRLDLMLPDNRNLPMEWCKIQLENLERTQESRNIRFVLPKSFVDERTDIVRLQVRERLQSSVQELNRKVELWSAEQVKPAYQKATRGKSVLTEFRLDLGPAIAESLDSSYLLLRYSAEMPFKNKFQVLLEGGRGGMFMFMSGLLGAFGWAMNALPAWVKMGFGAIMSVFFVHGMFTWIKDWQEEARRKEEDIVEKAQKEAERAVLDMTRKITGMLEKTVDAKIEEYEREVQNMASAVRKELEQIARDEQSRLQSESQQRQQLIQSEKTSLSKMESAYQNLQRAVDSAMQTFQRRST